jgi:hypothetical protein
MNVNDQNDQIDDTDADADNDTPVADETQEGIARQLVDILCEDAVPKAFNKKKVKGNPGGKKGTVASAPGAVKYGKK